MPEIGRFLRKEEVYYVRGYGDLNYTNCLNTIKNLISAIDTFCINDILCNHSLVEKAPNLVEAFNLGSFVGQKFKALNLAIIYPPKLKEGYSLFENAGNKRGANIKIFSDKKSAIHWLINLRECNWN